MSTRTASLDLETAIMAALAGHQEGLTREALQQAVGLGQEEPWRFRRRLEALEKRQRIRKVGITRGMRYVIGAPAPVAPAGLHEAAWGQSPEGAQVLALVNRPRDQRLPCTYDRSFLDAYRPNETQYLRVADRTRLHALGRTPEAEAPAGTHARKVLERLLIDLSWNSSRLEGNTYSLLDTERLFKAGSAPEGKSAQEPQMILNHKAAIEYLVNDAGNVDFTEGTILSLHALLSDGLMLDGSACGRIRNRPVEIGGSVYMPIAMPQRLEDLFHIILSTAQEIRDPFEQSFFIMVHLPYLQPFEDVNKRVSRLAANIPMIKRNLCPLSFVDVPERAYVDALLGVYELNGIELLRDVFVWAYERSCQQYLAVQRDMVPPDTFRLRHRAALSQVIKTIVSNLQAPTPPVIKGLIPPSVAEADPDKFVDLVMEEFKHLHEGNAVRFGIGPFVFKAWADGSKNKQMDPLKLLLKDS